MKHEIQHADIRRRAIASVKAQIDSAASTLHHRSVELEQLLRDQATAEARARARRDKFRWMTRGYRTHF